MIGEYIVDLSSGDSRQIKSQISRVSESKQTTSIAVSPLYVDMAALTIGSSTPEIVAVLSCGTYPEVTLLECALAIENGADQIEAPIYTGELIECGSEQILAELNMIKEEIDGEAELSLRIYGDASDAKVLVQILQIAAEVEASSIKIVGDESQIDMTAATLLVEMDKMNLDMALKCNYIDQKVGFISVDMGVELIHVTVL